MLEGRDDQTGEILGIPRLVKLVTAPVIAMSAGFSGEAERRLETEVVLQIEHRVAKALIRAIIPGQQHSSA